MDTYGGSFDIDNIGLLDVSDIIVSRGTSSALYGARGTVGSINIIKAPPQKMYVNAVAESDHLYNHVLSIAHGMPIGDFYYMISASYDKSTGYTVSKKLDRETRENWVRKLSRYDLYARPTNIVYDPARTAAWYYVNDTGKWDHVTHEKYKINGKIGYHITSKLEAGITSFYDNSKMENSIYNTYLYSIYSYNDTKYGPYWITPVNITSDIMTNISSRWPENNDYAVSPFVNYKGDRFELKVNAYFYEQYNRFISFRDPLETNLTENTVNWSVWQNRTYGLNIYPSFKISESQKLSFAASYYIGSHSEIRQEYDSRVMAYMTNKYKTMEINAAYLTLAAEDEIKFGKNTELSVGASYDSQNLLKYRKREVDFKDSKMVDKKSAYTGEAMLYGTMDSFSPVIGITSRVAKGIKLRGSASYKTAFPSLQAYANTTAGVKGENPIETLKPEKSINGNTGAEVSFFDGSLTLGCDYFFSVYFDRLVQYYQSSIDDYTYRNMDSSYLQGSEAALRYDIWDIAGVADISFGFTHTYIYARNKSKLQVSNINRGHYFERLPEHKFTIDFRLYFTKTKTSLFVFGYYEYGQIQYTMKYRPEARDPYTFTTDCFYPQKLNDPLMIDIKISQKVFTGYGDYEAYLMCKNVMDDYLADPFNPGPGRTFYLGLKAGY
jgi:hypothetical protein